MNSPTISDVERQAREAAERLKVHQQELQVAAMPTKSEVFVVAGRGARQMHDDIEALITALSAQKSEREEWQDISTAPKDGESVLIWKPDERMVGEYMMAAYWDDAHYSGEPGWVPVGGHLKQGYRSSVTRTDQGYPTHWRPLPAPPAIRNLKIEVDDAG